MEKRKVEKEREQERNAKIAENNEKFQQTVVRHQEMMRAKELENDEKHRRILEDLALKAERERVFLQQRKERAVERRIMSANRFSVNRSKYTRRNVLLTALCTYVGVIEKDRQFSTDSQSSKQFASAQDRQKGSEASSFRKSSLQWIRRATSKEMQS